MLNYFKLVASEEWGGGVGAGRRSALLYGEYIVQKRAEIPKIQTPY